MTGASAAPPGTPGGLALGLDIGGTSTRGVLVDEDARVRADVRLPTRAGPDGVAATASAVAHRLIADAAPTAVASVGVGVPGVVDVAAGTVRDAVNLAVSAPLDLAGRLRETLGVPTVAVDNDLNVAVRGAARRVTPTGTGDVVLLALGTGLAAGVMLDGAVRRGHAGAAGEVGHLVLRPDGPVCACGQRGCLERYVSGSALESRWPSRHGRPAPQELLEAATAGDPAAVELWEEFGAALAVAVRVVALTYDVEHILVGGGVSRLGEPLRALLCRHLDADAARSPFLARLRLGERVALIPPDEPVGPVGAALLGREAAAAGSGEGAAGLTAPAEAAAISAPPGA